MLQSIFFQIILPTKKYKNIGVLLPVVLLAVIILGGLAACSPKAQKDPPVPAISSGQAEKEDIKTPLPDSLSEKPETTPEVETPSVDEPALRGKYFDFAIKYRLDYIPFFSEENAPPNSTEYLYYAFAINLDNWGDDKGTMKREYVEEVIHSHFEVGEIIHEAMPRGWYYDGAKYTAVPTGINYNPIYALSKLESSMENGRRVYNATLGCYNENSGSIPSDEDMKKIRESIMAGDLSRLTLIQTEKLRYYMDDKTGEPVFLAHTLLSSSIPDNTAPDKPDPDKPDPVYDPASYLSNEEMITAGGVRLTMTYNEVLAIIGKPDEAYNNAPGVKSLIKGAYHYGFYQINESFGKDFPLPIDKEYYLLNILAEENCTDPLPRGIRIGDNIEDVMSKFPTQDKTLRKWARQTVYGRQEIGHPRAFLEFTTVLGTYRICATTTTQILNIHFDKQEKVRSVDLIFEMG